MTYDIGVRNVMRTLGSSYSYIFRSKSDLADAERAIALGLCEDVSLDQHTGIPHILEKTVQHMWGRFTHQRGLL